MNWYLGAFLIVCCCMFDRARGDKFDLIDRAVEQAMYGLSIAFLSGLSDWRVVVVAGLWWAGCSIGWGGPLGAFLDRTSSTKPGRRVHIWQVGPLRHNAALALAARGLIWGLPLLFVGWYVSPRWYFVAALMPIVVLGAAWIARATDWRFLGSTWEQQEYYRGLLAGIVTAGVFYV